MKSSRSFGIWTWGARCVVAAMGVLAACSDSPPSGAPPSDGTARDASADDAETAPTDAGAASTDGGTPQRDGGSLGAPIVASSDAWTFVDFPDTKCAYGTATGIGINPHADAETLLIFLEGGGACSTVDDCYTSPAASHLAGYDATTFGNGPRAPAVLTRGTTNPLAMANMVFVPYCTGDLHSGTATATFLVNGTSSDTYFWGARDMDSFLDRIVPTFPKTRHIVLVGTSAGGFGTLFNFDRIRLAFPGVRVDVLDDSGPAIDPTSASKDALGVSVWGTAFPTGCCARTQDLYDYDRALQPDSRFGFLSFEYDRVIGPRFGYGTAGYPAALDPFVAHIQAGANAATFIVANSPDAGAHVVESNASLDSADLAWIERMVNGDPAWTSITVNP